MNRVICGDYGNVLPTIPVKGAAMVFADPPDNLGVEYDGFEDKWPSEWDYIQWLASVIGNTLCYKPETFWLTYNWKWDIPLKMEFRWIAVGLGSYDVKPYVWWFKFGQHRESDNGSCFRPMLRFSLPGKKWNTDDIREPSARQREYGDKRANPRGRVPGDVWDSVWEIPRVCGTFKEKRKWHKNQHPEALIERMVRMSTNPGDQVIDLFAGTGTVARVCKRLGRDCISIDISPTYCDRIREELGYGE